MHGGDDSETKTCSGEISCLKCRMTHYMCVIGSQGYEARAM